MIRAARVTSPRPERTRSWGSWTRRSGGDRRRGREDRGRRTTHNSWWFYQAGTSFHMNVNEVIANRACELWVRMRKLSLVHPNDHVNMAQSTNDVIPTSMRLATTRWPDR
jgi:hypothetical protein